MVAIGVVTAALVVVLSVFNGFEDLVKQMYGDFYPDLQISASKGIVLQVRQEDIRAIKEIGGVASVERVIEQRAVLLDQEDKSIVWLKGVDSTYSAFSGIANHMVRGSFFIGDSAKPAIVVGVGVEQLLQVVAGQSAFPITIYLPNPTANASSDPLEAIISANAFPSGSFAVQQEFDEQYAFTQIDFLKYMMGYSDTTLNKIEIFLHPDANVNGVKSKLEALGGNIWTIKDKFQQNQSLFSAMKTEKLIIYAIAFLILVIAGFNIISSLTMTVLEKERDMAVLMAMGATPYMVRSIFQYLGMLLGLLGALSGFVIGLLICLGQQHFHWVKLAGQSFIIDYYPVAVRASDVAVILTLVFLIALISAFLPAQKAVATHYSLR